MKTALFAAVALTATSLPVLAQTSSGSPNPTAGGTSGSTMGSPGAAGQQGGSQAMVQSGQNQAVSQGKVRQVLQTAGFQDIRIVDAAYLVQARAPSGETVMMLVNPGGTLQGAAGPTGSAGSAGAGSAASGSGTPGGTSAPPPANRPQ